jgi:hypothetical protein
VSHDGLYVYASPAMLRGGEDMMKISHYTSEHGLVGIVRSQSLWATDFSALNDTTEFAYAMSAILEEVVVVAREHNLLGARTSHSHAHTPCE